MCGIFARPAMAQAGGVQTVIVIDFVNKSGVGGDALARLATDAVAVELANSARFEILKRDEVTRQAQELGLRAPFDQIAKTRLAQALGASAIVEGAVEYARETNQNPRTYNVGLTVRVSEAATGDLLSGAAQVGSAVGRPGQADRDSLIQEAATNAAVLSVRQIISYNLPEGTVLNTVGNEPNVTVLVNRGSRDGVVPGMEMIILRERQRVGRIRITTVYPTDAESIVLENTLGIRPEDKARAVFPMPVFDIHGNVRPTAKRGNTAQAIGTIGKLLLVVLVGLVIAQAAKGGSASVTGVTSEPDVVNQGPAVRIRWRDNIFGSGQTLEYHVWRTPDNPFNYLGTPVANVGGGMREYTDFPAPYSYWNGTNSFLQPGFPITGTGGSNNQGNAADEVTPAAGEIPGFITGLSHFYLVTAVLRRPVVVPPTGNQGGGGGGNQGGTEDIETDPVRGGQTTPLNPILVTTPLDQSPNINFTAPVSFTFQSQAGADEFQLEISPDRTFRNPNLIKVIGPIPSTAPGATGAVQTFNVPALITIGAGGAATGDPILMRDPTFAAFVARTTGARPVLYWRIGGRNSQDRPGPVHWISRRHDDGDRTFRWIYSQPARTFTPAELPPPPPGG
jgi:hypothetical protein